MPSTYIYIYIATIKSIRILTTIYLLSHETIYNNNILGSYGYNGSEGQFYVNGGKWFHDDDDDEMMTTTTITIIIIMNYYL